jgi:ADP-ribose pyrophosphatase
VDTDAQRRVSEALDRPPSIRVEVEEDRTEGARCDRGFLKLKRLTLRNHYADGTASAAYAYDVVERDALDAVAIVLWAEHAGVRSVCLRSALRPPLAFRHTYATPLSEPRSTPVIWEIPAGLVEPDERGEEGLRACAARETLEEVGLVVEPGAFAPLGPAAYLSPGVLAEKLHYVAARVDPSERTAPTEDGTPTEERAEVRFVALGEALAACRDGRISDVKTETAIRRLAELA